MPAGLGGRLATKQAIESIHEKSLFLLMGGMKIPQRVFAGDASDEVLAFAFIAFFSGGKLYAPDITCSFYPVWASLFGAEYRTIPLTAGFDVCADDYLRLDGGVIFANPNAPTGKLLSLREAERIVGANPNRVVIIDEAYIDFAPEGSSAVPLTDKYSNLLVTQTASKGNTE
ncbi:MAG: aminotransferase class I/II-fold pyridoxal phosphate-dependent enzyme [Azoarcus sp.]|nr:aminotransferase class I/II-fold pyridoxal phosphate-dependent enzyme [Azoarcus sp.]